MVFEHLQGWWLHHFPGQPVPAPDHSFSKEIFPNIQSKPPLTQLEAILSCKLSRGREHRFVPQLHSTDLMGTRLRFLSPSLTSAMIWPLNESKPPDHVYEHTQCLRTDLQKMLRKLTACSLALCFASLSNICSAHGLLYHPCWNWAVPGGADGMQAKR